MRLLNNTIAAIRPVDAQSRRRAGQKWDAVAKPLGSLGLLEDAVIQMAGICGTSDFSIGNKVVVVMCADNGVVSEGISQTGQEVSCIVAANMAAGRSSVCKMARIAGAGVFPVDIGLAHPVEGLSDRHIMRGTGNIRVGPAMSKDQAISAVEAGIGIAQQLAEQGYNLFATGEMGIGNTTTSAAVLSVLLNQPVEQVTGRGAGLTFQGLQNKIRVIRDAIRINQPDPTDALDVLCKLGGLDIAGLAGVCLGGALCRVPVVLDGLISLAAALVAVRICPEVRGYLLASHCTAEPAGRLALDALGLKPIIYGEMRLGEGTGAVALMPLLDMAMEVYHGDTFGDIAVEAYQHLE